MEHVAEEVAIVEPVDQIVIKLRRQLFKPGFIVAAQGDIQRQNILHFFRMHRVIAHGGTGGGKPMQKGMRSLFAVAGEKLAATLTEIVLQIRLRFGNAFAGHLQHQVVLILIAVLLKTFRQMGREQVTDTLQQTVGEVRLHKAELVQPGINPALEGEEERHLIGAELVDHHESIFAVHFGNIEDIAVHIFTRHRQMGELCQDMTADLTQHGGVVGADIKYLLLWLSRKGIQTHGKHRKLTGAAGGFKQPAGVSVKARRRIGVNVTYPPGVFMVRGVALIPAHVALLPALIIQPPEDLFRRVAQIDSQMVNQLEFTAGVHLRKQRHLTVGRSAFDQRAAGVVTDPAQHRRTDTGGANDRMRLAPERFERFFQLIERAAGKREDLFAAINQLQPVETQGADDHHRTIVIVAAGGGTLRQAGICRLHQDNGVRADQRLQDPPEFKQRPRKDHRQRIARAGAKAGPVARGLLRVSQQMRGTNQTAQVGNQCRVRKVRIHEPVLVVNVAFLL